MSSSIHLTITDSTNRRDNGWSVGQVAETWIYPDDVEAFVLAMNELTVTDWSETDDGGSSNRYHFDGVSYREILDDLKSENPDVMECMPKALPKGFDADSEQYEILIEILW